MKLLLGSQTYQGQSGGVAGQRLVNMYASINPEGSKYPFSLRGTAGLKLWCDLGTGAPVQGMIEMNGALYAVSNNYAFSIDQYAAATTLTGALTGSQGRLSMAHNGTGGKIVAVNPDGDGFIISTTAVSAIVDVDYNDALTVCFLDGFHVFARKNSAQIFKSASYDATSYNSLEYRTVEKSAGYLKSTVSFNGALWNFKEGGYEVWENTGNESFPFEVIRSSVNTTRGLGATFSIAQEDNSLFFMGNDRIVYTMDGYSPVVISTDAIAVEFQSYDYVDDAFGFIYTQNGHKFYILTFPSEEKTWCFDIATRLWHERLTSGLGRWRPNCFAYFAGKNLVGDFQTGKIYELDLETYTDADDEMEALVEGTVIWSDESLLKHDSIRLDMKSGVGLQSGQGEDPQVMMQYSDDGGRTWSNERWVSFGRAGEYKTRPIWRRNGQSRERIYRFKITDPVERVINGAYINEKLGVF